MWGWLQWSSPSQMKLPRWKVWISNSVEVSRLGSWLSGITVCLVAIWMDCRLQVV